MSTGRHFVRLHVRPRPLVTVNDSIAAKMLTRAGIQQLKVLYHNNDNNNNYDT